MNLREVKLVTDRLCLISIVEKYREYIFTEFTPEVTQYMFPKSPDTIEETDIFISESIDNMEKGEEIVLVVLNKETDEFLGVAGLHNIHTPHPELGIWIKKKAHGNRYGGEAIRAIKEWADTNIVYDYIIYPVDKRNINSKKIAESLGGVIKKEYKQKGMGGQQLDEVEYHIYKQTI